MSEQVNLLKGLAEQAQQEVRRDRRARCWLFHAWSKWQTEGRLQSRVCLGCGITQALALPCAHVWHTYWSPEILTETGTQIGRVHDQQCLQCGDLRRLVHTNSP